MRYANRLRYGKPNVSESNKNKSTSRKCSGLQLITLSCLLMLSGCASNSIISKAVVVQTSNAAITEPSDASGFYQRLTTWREKVRGYLKSETQD